MVANEDRREVEEEGERQRNKERKEREKKKEKREKRERRPFPGSFYFIFSILVGITGYILPCEGGPGTRSPLFTKPPSMHRAKVTYRLPVALLFLFLT